MSGKKCDAQDSKKHSSYPSRLKKSNVRVISRSMSFYARIGIVILPGPAHYGIVVIESFEVLA